MLYIPFHPKRFSRRLSGKTWMCSCCAYIYSFYSLVDIVNNAFD